MLNREQYYLGKIKSTYNILKIKPIYNILKIYGSSLGYKHSGASKIKISYCIVSETTFNKMRIRKQSEKT